MSLQEMVERWADMMLSGKVELTGVATDAWEVAYLAERERQLEEELWYEGMYDVAC